MPLQQFAAGYRLKVRTSFLCSTRTPHGTVSAPSALASSERASLPSHSRSRVCFSARWCHQGGSARSSLGTSGHGKAK
jgi:hypothetical protein